MPRKKIILGTLGALCIAGALAFVALPHGGYAFAQMMGHSGQHGHGHGHGHGADGTGHDMVNMPGLRGDDVSEEETAEMALMFRQFQSITRSVDILPNGIRTVTGSDDPQVMAAIASHVTVMINRVEEGRDPGVFIQSPTLDIFFERGDQITTEIDVTDAGIVVVQSSEDPELVTALHVHAAEVTDMADRGMDAVHERMMQRAGN